MWRLLMQPYWPGRPVFFFGYSCGAFFENWPAPNINFVGHSMPWSPNTELVSSASVHGCDQCGLQKAVMKDMFCYNMDRRTRLGLDWVRVMVIKDALLIASLRNGTPAGSLTRAGGCRRHRLRRVACRSLARCNAVAPPAPSYVRNGQQGVM